MWCLNWLGASVLCHCSWLDNLNCTLMWAWLIEWLASYAYALSWLDDYCLKTLEHGWLSCSPLPLVMVRDSSLVSASQWIETPELLKVCLQLIFWDRFSQLSTHPGRQQMMAQSGWAQPPQEENWTVFLAPSPGHCIWGMNSRSFVSVWQIFERRFPRNTLLYFYSLKMWLSPFPV